MGNLIGLIGSLAVLCLGTAGLLSILGLRTARNYFLRIALVLVLLSIVVPFAVATITQVASESFGSIEYTVGEISPAIVLLVVIGHLVLGVVLLRRRFGGVERARRGVGDIERARGRERVRLPPGEGGGP